MTDRSRREVLALGAGALALAGAVVPAAATPAEAATRIRLAATENIIVVAKTSKGQFLTEQKPVKVTIGGCGG